MTCYSRVLHNITNNDNTRHFTSESRHRPIQRPSKLHHAATPGGLWEARVKTKTAVAGPETTACKPLQQERSDGLWCPSKSLAKSNMFLLMSLKAGPTGNRLRKQQWAFRVRRRRAELRFNYLAAGSRLLSPGPHQSSSTIRFSFSNIKKLRPGVCLSSCSQLLSLSLSKGKRSDGLNKQTRCNMSVVMLSCSNQLLNLPPVVQCVLSETVYHSMSDDHHFEIPSIIDSTTPPPELNL